MAATIQDVSNFAGPREFAAFLGLTPRQNSSGGDLLDAANNQNDGATISLPFAATRPIRKGISHTPSGGQAIDEATRSALLMAIARSKAWVDTIVKDPATDIGTIAKRENLAERHVRFLAPLAYLSHASSKRSPRVGPLPI
jgi:Transposase IS116/IS110/IS902 family